MRDISEAPPDQPVRYVPFVPEKFLLSKRGRLGAVDIDVSVIQL